MKKLFFAFFYYPDFNP